MSSTGLNRSLTPVPLLASAFSPSYCSAGKVAATTLWEQPIPFGQKEPFVPIILLLNAMIWSYCDLLVSRFLPTGSPLSVWVATPMAVPRGDNQQRSRSIQYRLSRNRVTSSSEETLNEKNKKKKLKWCEREIRISPQVAAKLTNNAAVLPTCQRLVLQCRKL